MAEDGDGLDVWKKTVLTGCVFVRTTVRSVSGADVSIGADGDRPHSGIAELSSVPGVERKHEGIHGLCR